MQKKIIAYAIILISVAGLVVASVMTSACGNGRVDGKFPEPGFEECDDGNKLNGDGCSSLCRVEFPERIYVAPYVGNIDGHFTEDWFFFYDQLTEFFDKEKIPAGFSIYPATLDNTEFRPHAKKMYESQYVELVQKAWTGAGREQHMDSLGYGEQRDIIIRGREAFRKNMAKIMGIPEGKVRVPVAYNQPQGRFTEDTRRALESLGFRIFFEMYMNDDLGPVNSTNSFDVIQYGVGLTTTGDAGRDTAFFQPGEILEQIRDFYREDLNMVFINGSRVVPLWVHQQDFESIDKPNAVNKTKWDEYTYILRRIKGEPNLVLVSPSDIWEMRHKTEN